MKTHKNNSLWMLVLVLTGAVFIWGCGRAEKDGSPTLQHQPERSQEIQAEKSDTLYQCPMHLQIIQHRPGSCPICGMDLVPIRNEVSGDSMAVETDTEIPIIRVDPAVVRNVALRTETVSYRTLSRELRLNGKIAVDEERIFSVTARIGGYVERLAVVSVGQKIKQGQTLLELYSPELMTAQQEYLQGGESALGARERLLNWGVSSAFLTRLEKTGQPNRLVPIVAPSSGTITRKEVVKGQGVSAGMELFRIADLSEVWVTARLYQADLAWVKTGAKASVRLRNLPGREFNARVVFVSPELDPSTRTGELRLKLKNTVEQDLRPEMFAEVLVAEEAPANTLVVPSHSLIRAGSRNIAMVALGENRFQARQVGTGKETGDWVEILSGLKESEKVVVNAQFLLDSESNLRAVVARIQGESASRKEDTHDH